MEYIVIVLFATRYIKYKEKGDVIMKKMFKMVVVAMMVIAAVLTAGIR